MLPASCDGDGIEHLEEVEREHIQQPLRRALFWVVDMCPGIVLCLSRAEDVLDGAIDIQLVIDEFLPALVSQLQLIFQVVEAIVDRGSREHQDFGPHAGADDLVHQSQVAVLAWVLVLLVRSYLPAVAEVMTLVNDDEIIVAPVQQREVKAVALALLTAEVGVEEHIVAQAVLL